MFNFLKSKFTKVSSSPDADALVDEFARQESRHYSHKLADFTAGVKYKNSEPQFQRDVVFSMLNWLENNPRSLLYPRDNKAWMLDWKMLDMRSIL